MKDVYVAHQIPEYIMPRNGGRYNVRELLSQVGVRLDYRLDRPTSTVRRQPISAWDNLIQLSVISIDQIQAQYPRSTREECVQIQEFARRKVNTNPTQRRRRQEYLEGLKS
jgi:hypothetical protein